MNKTKIKKIDNKSKKEVELDLDPDTLLKLCMLAHKEDITLNQFVEKILREKLPTFKKSDIQLLNE
jgi:predicted HicB family RNase H-like nuclease